MDVLMSRSTWMCKSDPAAIHIQFSQAIGEENCWLIS
jgi:hypothetical protein